MLKADESFIQLTCDVATVRRDADESGHGLPVQAVSTWWNSRGNEVPLILAGAGPGKRRNPTGFSGVWGEFHSGTTDPKREPPLELWRPQSRTLVPKEHLISDLPMAKGVGILATCRPPSHLDVSGTESSSDKLCRWSASEARASLSVSATVEAKRLVVVNREHPNSGSRIFVFVCFGVLEEEKTDCLFHLRRPGSGAVGHRRRLLLRRAPAGGPPSFLRHPDF